VVQIYMATRYVLKVNPD